MEQNLTVIQNFNVLPTQSLELLGQRLGLRMSRAELLFCARRYKSRGKGEVSIDALRFIDALACPERISLEKIAIGELLTDHAYIADAFADAVAGLKALGKAPEKPFILADIAALSARYIAAARSKDITEPIGYGGTAAHYAALGFGVLIPLESEAAHFDVLRPLGLGLKSAADRGDALVLLCPMPDASPEEFDKAAVALLQSELGKSVHCVCDLEKESMAHALLRITGGALLNLANLPEQLQELHALTKCRTGLLLAMPSNTAQAMLAQARARGLGAYEPGTVDRAGYLIVRRGKNTLLALDMPYLKSVCFIRSYKLRLEDKPTAALPVTLPLHAPAEALDQSLTQKGDALRTLPPLRTRNACYVADTSYRAAMLCAAKAYCSAVASGSAPERVWLNAQVRQQQTTMANAASELLCTLLGLYRFSKELDVPVHTDAAFTTDQGSIAVLASAPSDMVIPQSLTGNGKVYLLAPRTDADGMPVYSELRALISYLRRAVTEGKVKSARFVCIGTPAQALAEAASTQVGFVPNPHAKQLLDTPAPFAFLVESEGELAGELIAVSTQADFAQNVSNTDNNS